VKKTKPPYKWGLVQWRRKRDSNPRRYDPQQFSRLPQSTTLPFLRRKNTKKLISINRYYELSEFYSKAKALPKKGSAIERRGKTLTLNRHPFVSSRDSLLPAIELQISDTKVFECRNLSS
jgi:hypothetical protein